MSEYEVDETMEHRPPPEPFSLTVVTCPSCKHGIDPHVAWREPCGVGDARGRRCPCLWTPNDIAGTLLGWWTAATPAPRDAHEPAAGSAAGGEA